MTTTKAATARILLAFAQIIFLSGCESFECDRYRDFVEKREKHNELIAWADRTIFFRTIRPENIQDFGLVGPGRSRLVSEEEIDYQPPFLPDVEIRLIGDDPYNPTAIFLGRSGFKGLIVGTSDVSNVVALSGIQPNEVLAKKGRVALVCRPFR